MADNARLFRNGSQAPLIHLIISILLILVAGTVIFYLLALIGALLFGISPGEIMNVMSGNLEEEKKILVLKYLQMAQQAGVFLAPSLIYLYLTGRNRGNYTGLSLSPGFTTLMAVFLLSACLVVINNYAGYINSKINLPGSFSGIEKWMLKMENEASDITSALLNSENTISLLITVLIMAVTPALCEELLFRGVLQQLFISFIKSSHGGIIITAVIFSTLHFQFYGFIPRFFLGLAYGYLFFWTGNLWITIIAHFVNNAVPVIMSYHLQNTVRETVMDETNNLVPSFPFLSLATAILILWWFRREWKRRNALHIKPG
jgi:membrane protease YdiL (CAAX protease family)